MPESVLSKFRRPEAMNLEPSREIGTCNDPAQTDYTVQTAPKIKPLRFLRRGRTPKKAYREGSNDWLGNQNQSAYMRRTAPACIWLFAFILFGGKGAIAQNSPACIQ